MNSTTDVTELVTPDDPKQRSAYEAAINRICERFDMEVGDARRMLDAGLQALPAESAESPVPTRKLGRRQATTAERIQLMVVEQGTPVNELFELTTSWRGTRLFRCRLCLRRFERMNKLAAHACLTQKQPAPTMSQLALLRDQREALVAGAGNIATPDWEKFKLQAA